MYYNKLNGIIVILLIVIVLIIFAAGSALQRQPQITYVTNPAPQKPDAYIFHYRSQPAFDIEKRKSIEGVVGTALVIENRGASGLITVAYGAVNVTAGWDPTLLEEKQYYVKGGEKGVFSETWNMPPNRNYVQCTIVKQEIAD